MKKYNLSLQKGLKDVLTTPCSDVDDFKDILDISNKMIAIMEQHNGIGIAAPQVGLSKKIFILHVDKSSLPFVVVNPEITYFSEEKMSFEEGCLSLPNEYVTTNRSQNIIAKYQDAKGNHHEGSFHDLSSICFQHENDHLNGILMIDYLSDDEKKSAIKRLKNI